MIRKKLNRSTLRGVWPALIIPWTGDDQLDVQRLIQEVRAYQGTGIHGVYTGGTTGEFYAFDDHTFRQISEIVCGEAHDMGLPAQIGCTTLCTRTACQRIRWAIDATADAIHIALPFWLELKDDEAVAFFHAIADAAEDMPIVLYHTNRAKRKFSPQLIGRIATEIPSFIGMKDTGCDVDTLRAILTEVPDLSVFGAEHELVEKMQAGGKGTYAAVTGLNAAYLVSVFDAFESGDHRRAAELQLPVSRLTNEVLIPLIQNDGLLDSAIDRILRTVGGVDVGLRCQPPYRSGNQGHVTQIREWCAANAPALLARNAACRGPTQFSDGAQSTGTSTSP